MKDFNKNDWTVIKLGGSILSPKVPTSKNSYSIPFDYSFAVELLNHMKKWQSQKYLNRLAVIIGGGFLNKQYLETTMAFIKSDNLDTEEISHNLKDHIGLASIALNAHVFLMLATSFFGEKEVYQDVIKYKLYDNLADIKIGEYNKLVVGGGNHPGHSSDLDALLLAKFFNTKQIISMKNVDGVYDKDPNSNPDAKYFKHLTWKEYKEIIGEIEYEPRSHFPIDVVAAKEAEESNVEFIVMDGRDIVNVEKFLKGESSKCTSISS